MSEINDFPNSIMMNLELILNFLREFSDTRNLHLQLILIETDHNVIIKTYIREIAQVDRM